MEIAVILLSVLLVLAMGALIFFLFRVHSLKKSVMEKDNYDDLTGLPNKTAFFKDGAVMLEQGGKAAMMIFGVDDLGLITTLFGMNGSENSLRAMAGALRSVKRKDSVIARIDTVNFVLLTVLRSKTEADKIVSLFGEKLNELLAGTELCNSVNFRVGICRYDGCDDIETLYNKANLCLIMRNKSIRVSEFTPELEQDMVENELLRSEMSEALEKNQFELYYQPKVSFKTGQILGVEALIRWHHPTKGFVPPCDFIPLAEKTGIITKIDEWGLMTACSKCKEWQGKGLPPVKVSVNMSQAQFMATDVYSTIVNTLEQTGLDPKYLEIEVTETMAMTDVAHTVEVLSHIHQLGVSISMDDFGTGYSSLASLKAIPFDVLKIDRSLVCDVSDNETARRITGAIVAMGRALRMQVLAEGVETGEQCGLLSEIGCDLAQGYYFSKPHPASEIEALLLAPTNEQVG